MKTKASIKYAIKLVLTSGIALFSSSGLNAWTISVLSPETTLPEYSSYDGVLYGAFRSYLTGAGSSLASGTLSGYAMGSSDAVIINVIESGHKYTSSELSVLTDLLNSNTRVLLFSENSLWNLSNDQLASLLGGVSSRNDGIYEQTLIHSYPLITDGVSNVYFPMPGKISPSGSQGTSLFNGDGLTLWGQNDSFLLAMDVNVFEDNYLNMSDNDRLARNVANWLSGVDIAPIPEPSSYAMGLASITLAFMALRRQRKQ